MMYRFYIGERQRDGREVRVGQWYLVEDALLAWAGGFSRFNCDGAWKSPGGTIIRELTRVYEVITDKLGARGIAEELRRLAKQECVLLVSLDDQKDWVVS